MTDDTAGHTNNDPGGPDTSMEHNEWSALDKALDPIPLEHYAAPDGPNPMDEGPAFQNRLRRRRSRNKAAKLSRKKNRSRRC